MPDADLEAVHRHLLQVANPQWAHAAGAASATGNRVAFIHRVCALHGDGRPAWLLSRIWGMSWTLLNLS